MKPTLNHFTSLAASAVLAASVAFPAMMYGRAPGTSIASRTAEIDGVKLHYLTAGHGPALILLHGYAENSLMWRPIMPLLAERFTVIAPDLPGIGDSAIPADGLDMKTADARAGTLTGRREGEGRWARHRSDGRICLRRSVPC